MAYFEAAEGDTIQLTFNSAFKDTGLTVTAEVYDTAGAQVGGDVSLTHRANGFYNASYVVPTGNEYLSIYTFDADPTDEATAVDHLKVRFLTPFGSGASAMGGGITSDEINEIVKRLKKINVWDVKLPSGRTAAQELMVKSEFKFTPEVISAIWNYKLSSGNPAQKELQAKSEFNPKKDIVKTDIDFSSIQSMMQSGFNNMQKSMKGFDGINKSISALKEVMPKKDNSMMNVIENMAKGVGKQMTDLSTSIKTIEGKFQEINIDKVDANVSETRELLKSLNKLKDDQLDILSQNTLNVFQKINLVNDNLDIMKKTFSSLDTSALNDIQKGVKKNNELLLDFDDLEKERMETLMKNIIQFLKDIMAEIKGNNQSMSELSRNVSGVASGLLLNRLQ